MLLFALGLIFPILAINGQNDLYQIILKSGVVLVNGPHCDGCEFHLFHHVSPSGTNVTKNDNGPRSDATLKFSLNSTLVTELKSHGITHHVCLIRRMVPTDNNAVNEVEESTVFCQQRPPFSFEEACVNRNPPEPEKVVTLFCPENIKSICTRVLFKYRMYVESESGEQCPGIEIRKATRYYVTLEATEEYFHKQDCDGCHILVQYTIFASGLYVMKRDYSSPHIEHKDKFVLTSTDINNWKSNGVSFTVCMKIKVEPTHSNGLRVAQDLEPVCHHESNVPFEEACANRYRSKKLVQLQYPSEGDMSNVTVWDRYIFYLETEFGKPCPIIEEHFRLHWERTDTDIQGARIGNMSLQAVFSADSVNRENVLYRIVVETRELLVYNRGCDGCEFFIRHLVSPYGAKERSFDTGSSGSYPTLKFTLNSTLVTELKSDGITHHVCLIKRVVPTASNGVVEAVQSVLFCQQQTPLTFAEACANRNHTQAEKHVILHCPDHMSGTCSRASVRYRIFIETVSGEPCAASEMPKVHVYYLIFERTGELFEGCNFCTAFFPHRITPSGPTVVTPDHFLSTFHTYNTTLKGEKVNELKANGISFKTCEKSINVERQDVCETKQTLTFAEACANRFRPDARRLLVLSASVEQYTNRRIFMAFDYRFYVEAEFGKPCHLSEEPFRLNWELADIDVRGACGSCSIRPAIRLGKMSLRTEFVTDTDIDDEQVWDFIIHGMNYTELWYVDTHPTELPTDVSYAAEVPGYATVAELCAGITANRVVPCKPSGTGRNICSEISYILKLSLTTKSGEPCPSDTLRMLQ